MVGNDRVADQPGGRKGVGDVRYIAIPLLPLSSSSILLLRFLFLFFFFLF